VIIYARKVQIIPQAHGRHDAIYSDLAKLDDGRFALVDGLKTPSQPGYIRETLSEGEALAKLQVWPDWTRNDSNGNSSQIWKDGRIWLRHATIVK
jgi:hypothetical protein